MADNQLVWIGLVPSEQRSAFVARLNQIAQELGVNPNWLMLVMYAESRVRASAYNATSRATGLIQFMPSTAKGLGTTVEALRQMNFLQQLEYVRKYFLPYKGRMNNYYDVYAVVFFPAAIGKPDNWVLSTSGLSASIIAKQNPAVNIVKDGQITVAEFKKYVDKTSGTVTFDKVVDATVNFVQENKKTVQYTGMAVGFILLSVASYFYLKGRK